MTRQEKIIFRILIVILILLFCWIQWGCNTTRICFDKKMGAWVENDTAIIGYAVGEMDKDSFFRMRTLSGWIIKVKSDEIVWEFQLPVKPHYPNPSDYSSVPKSETRVQKQREQLRQLF